MVISGSDDREADAVECDTSLLDDEGAILAIKIYTNKIGTILIVCDICNCSNSVDMTRDEVSIDTSLSSDTSLDVEYIPNFFASKIGTRKTLLHREECITLR